jgi:hypothetical protein
MVAALLGTGWKLLVVEAQRWTESYHTEVEQLYLGPASVVVVDSLQLERTDSAIAMLVEEHMD